MSRIREVEQSQHGQRSPVEPPVTGEPRWQWSVFKASTSGSSSRVIEQGHRAGSSSRRAQMRGSDCLSAFLPAKEGSPDMSRHSAPQLSVRCSKSGALCLLDCFHPPVSRGRRGWGHNRAPIATSEEPSTTTHGARRRPGLCPAYPEWLAEDAAPLEPPQWRAPTTAARLPAPARQTAKA
jgi:hypothetical protein